MVRWVVTDTQVLAAAAAECIYRYYHPVCNAGNLRSRHVIRLQRENDITSEWGGQKSKTLQLHTRLFLNCHFGTKHPHSRSDVRSFLKTGFGKQLWAHWYQACSFAAIHHFLDGLFTKCVNLLFSPSLSQVHNEIDRVGTDGKSRLNHLCLRSAEMIWLHHKEEK